VTPTNQFSTSPAADDGQADGPGETPQVTGASPPAGQVAEAEAEGSEGIVMTPVESSSHLAAIGYDNTTATLQVAFKDGEVYRYSNVPEWVMLDFITAKSQGRFFQQEIAQAFEYERIK